MAPEVQSLIVLLIGVGYWLLAPMLGLPALPIP